MGPSRNRPRYHAICQCYTHWLGVKCVWYQTCLWRADGKSCMVGCPLDYCRTKGPTRTYPPGGRSRAPTAPRLATNMNQNILEVSLIVFQIAHQVVFSPDAPAFTHHIFNNGEGWHALPSSADHRRLRISTRRRKKHFQRDQSNQNSVNSLLFIAIQGMFVFS